MTVINEKVLHQRNILLAVLVSVFVISVLGVSISILVIHPPRNDDGNLLIRQNILFIVVDDLRPTLGCYGDERAITPNIDQLARRSILFENAYAQQALCAPSRTSFLTSRRPDTLLLYDNTGRYWRENVGNFTTLPQHFKTHGYETISIGKIFHHGTVTKNDDYPYSWSDIPYRPSTQKLRMEPVCVSSDGRRHMNLICPVNVEEQPEKTLPDIQSVEQAIDYLRNKSLNSTNSDPFFLGVGFYKPHIPLKFPREYLDLYPIGSMDLAPNNTLPPKLPSVAWNPWMDIRIRDDVKQLSVSFPYGPLPEDFQKLVRQGYYASVSYMDDQLGKLLETLEETGFAKHTIIVLIGDHGWSLGEHQEWSKYSNFEVSVRVPMIMHIPDLTEEIENRKLFHHIPVLDQMNKTKSSNVKPGYVTSELVELVDVFPTLAEIADLSVPPLCKLNATAFCAEGLSFLPLIEHVVYDPEAEFSWKTATFSQYPRPSQEVQPNSDQPILKDITIMGYSIRTPVFRYTEWVKFDSLHPRWTMIIASELYDHYNDPLEMNNVCDEEDYSNVVIDLSRKLKNGWRYAMPPGEFDSPPQLGPYKKRRKSKGNI